MPILGLFDVFCAFFSLEWCLKTLLLLNLYDFLHATSCYGEFLYSPLKHRLFVLWGDLKPPFLKRVKVVNSSF